MDTLHSSKKIPKFKSVNGSVSPINTRLISESSLMKYLCGGSPITSSACKSNGNGDDVFSSPAISAKSSRGSSSGSSSRSFGRSLSPLLSVENVMSPPVYGTPAKVVDEDVLVMDGFLVQSTSGGRVFRSLSSDSGGSSSNSSSSPGIRVPKVELCRSWEDFGNCRFGSKCQFAHGKEELRPTCFSMKNKAETQSFKSHTAGSYSYAQKSRFLPPVMAEVAVAANRMASASKPEFKSKNPAINFNSEYSSKNTSPITRPPLYLSRTPALTKPELSNKSPTINIKSQEWTPLDDGIEVALPDGIDKCSSDRKDVGAYIHGILHGPRTRKRLPVFTEFCLD